MADHGGWRSRRTLRDQSPILAQDGVRRDDAGHLGQDPSPQFPTAHGATPPLGVRQAKWTITPLLAEDVILLTKVVDQIVLVPIQPARDGEDEKVQRLGHPMRLSGSVPR